MSKNQIISSDELSQEELNEILNFDASSNRLMEKSDRWYYGDNTLVSNSMLGQLAEGGPQRLLKYIQYPEYRKESEAFNVGRAFHCAILEPDEYDKRFFCLDDARIVIEIGGKKPRATNKYKDWHAKQLADNEGKTVIPVEDHNHIMRMRDRVWKNTQCLQLLTGGKPEQIYRNQLAGVPVKCKTDYYRKGQYVLDLKSYREAPTPQNWTREVLYKRDYDRQGAFYCDTVGCDSFWFIAIEKTPPYSLGIYEMSQETYERGQEKYLRLLDDYNKHFLNEGNRKNIDSFFFQGTV